MVYFGNAFGVELSAKCTRGISLAIMPFYTASEIRNDCFSLVFCDLSFLQAFMIISTPLSIFLIFLVV